MALLWGDQLTLTTSRFAGNISSAFTSGHVQAGPTTLWGLGHVAAGAQRIHVHRSDEQIP
jgi:hypothetical protein